MKDQHLSDYLFVLPGLLLSFTIILLPGILTVFYGFTDWNGVSDDFNWIGLRNFMELFSDEIFWRALFNNVKWTFMFLSVPVMIGLLTSFLLLHTRRFRGLCQGIYILPYILAPVTNAMLWLNIIFNPISGLIGYLNDLGWNIGAPLGNPATALYAVAAVDMWHYWGFLTVVYLAANRIKIVPALTVYFMVAMTIPIQLFMFVLYSAVSKLNLLGVQPVVGILHVRSAPLHRRTCRRGGQGIIIAVALQKEKQMVAEKYQ